MSIKRGDTIAFGYTPSFLGKDVYGRAVIRKVLRQNNSAVVKVWNGNVDPNKDRYEEIEVSLSKVALCKKKLRK